MASSQEEKDEPAEINKGNMATLEEIMQCEAMITCDTNLLGICEKYHEALETLTSICHTDPNFSHIACGTGFNHLPLLLHLRETETANVLHLAQPQPIQKILFVHRHSVILQDTETQWMKKCPLLYYLSNLECSKADHTKIFLSARTHGQMMRGAFEMPFSEESTIVREDEHGTIKFFLSSRSFQKAFEEQTPNCISAYRPVLGVVDKMYLDDSIDIKDSMREQPSETHALKMVPALYHPTWPSKAFGFLARSRPSGWPSHSLLQEISAGGCHVVPASPGTDVIPAPGESDDEDLRDEWQLNFDAAEKRLFQSLSIIDKQAAFMFQALICDRRSLNRGVITVEHIKTVILWAFENNAPSNEQPLLSRFLHICREFLDVLAKGVCRHYFLPKMNILDDIEMQVLEDIRDMIDGLLQQPWIFILHCQLLPYAFYDQRTNLEAAFFPDQKSKLDLSKQLALFRLWCGTIRDSLSEQIQQYLLTTFHDSIRLNVLTSHARLNKFTVNESIILHREMLRMVQDRSVQNKLFAPYVDIVSINLASLYHLQAMNVVTKREREYFLIKSEAMFRQSKEMDLCLGRTRLANQLYSTGRYPEAVVELQELLRLLDEDFAKTKPPDGEEEGQREATSRSIASTTPEQFSRVIWAKWMEKQYAFDVIYNRTLRPLCPAVMKNTTSLSMCNTLGVKCHSVAVFSPIFHARFMLALCHAGMRDNAQALPILLGLEAVLFDKELVKTLETSAYSDVNEKRIAAYYIVLGNCYVAIDEQEKAKEAFRQAMKVFPTPRNPANMLYMGVRYGDTIDGIQKGAKAIAVASAVSIAYNYISSNI